MGVQSTPGTNTALWETVNPDQYILHCNQNSLKKNTHTLWSFYESTDCIFFSLGPTETSVECYKWIFYMCLEGRIFHYNSSLTCIAAFYSSLLPNIAHGEFLNHWVFLISWTAVTLQYKFPEKTFVFILYYGL